MDTNIAEIQAKLPDYIPAFQAMEAGTATLADAAKVHATVALIKPYLDAWGEKAVQMLQARERLTSVLEKLPEDKRAQIISILDA